MKKKSENNLSVILLSGITALFFACENLEINREIKIKTDLVGSYITSAVVKGNILDIGESEIIDHGHCWSTTENPTILLPTKTALGKINSRGEFNDILSPLQPNTNYFVRAYATNSQGTVYGNEFSFITNIAIIWQKLLGGTGNDWASCIQQTTDGGYIISGGSASNDFDVSGNHGNHDYWIVKLLSSGELEWQKSLGGSGDEWATSIQQTNDGGYIIAGYSLSNDGNVSGNHGAEDYWIVKLTSTGLLEWQKSLGGSADDWPYSIQQTMDGGYIVAGFSTSNNGDVSGNHDNYDYWIVKLTSAGQLEWQKSLGGSGGDWAKSICQTADGGYIVVGHTTSNDGDVSGNHGEGDFWIVKLTPTGQLDWQKSFGGSQYDDAFFVRQTTDGGYIIAGCSSSNDGDVTGNHGLRDCWILKLSSTGQLDWQKSYGGSGEDYAFAIRQTPDGGYIIACESRSNDGDVTGNHGMNDAWIVKLTSTGQLDWQKSLGGSNYDFAQSIQQTSDGCFIIAGGSGSNDGEVTGNHGPGDFWIVKIK